MTVHRSSPEATGVTCGIVELIRCIVAFTDEISLVKSSLLEKKILSFSPFFIILWESWKFKF